MSRKLYYVAKNFTKQVSQDNISAYAASTAFFLFLSLIPLLILICSILPYTPVTEAMLMRVVTDLIPHSIDGLAVGLIKEVYDKSTGVLSLAAVVTVWISAKGMMALMRGLNAVNGVVEQRNYFVQRFIACIYTVLLLVVMMISLIILVFGNVLLNFFFRDFPAARAVADIFMHFRFLPIWLILTLVFMIIYTYVPQIKTKVRFQFPGALFSAVAWSVFSWGFSIYVDRFNGFSMYGNLTTVIISMLWLYFCMYILMIGANMNRYFYPAVRFLDGKRKKLREK